VVGVARTPEPSGASGRLLRFAAGAPAPVLADGINAEEVALSGHRVVIGNPLDAFPKREQRLYLDWLAGRPSGDAELRRADVVLVTVGSPPARRLARRSDFCRALHDRRAAVYVRGSCRRLTSSLSLRF